MLLASMLLSPISFAVTAYILCLVDARIQKLGEIK